MHMTAYTEKYPGLHPPLLAGWGGGDKLAIDKGGNLPEKVENHWFRLNTNPLAGWADIHLHLSRDIRTRTRNVTTVKVTFPKKEIFKTNTLFRGALDWNALDIYTRNIDSKFSFKKKQKQWALLRSEMPQ